MADFGGCAVCCALWTFAGLAADANLTVTADDMEIVIDTAARPMHRSRLNLQLIGATGTAWFDGFRMEEIVP